MMYNPCGFHRLELVKSPQCQANSYIGVIPRGNNVRNMLVSVIKERGCRVVRYGRTLNAHEVNEAQHLQELLLDKKLLKGTRVALNKGVCYFINTANQLNVLQSAQ